ncbi:hypothetical protein ACFJIW_13475 [Tahibacter sp. UC22_41]|uniref:hypothetical protein n=1 Tax=Tahibacter sp. UC22_41 TaxID=3350178 RepID=UPI0036DABD61
MNDKDPRALDRSLASLSIFRGLIGMFCGAALAILGITGKVIPAGGLPESAELGRALGERGTCALAVVIGLLFVAFFARWVARGVRTLRG